MIRFTALGSGSGVTTRGAVVHVLTLGRGGIVHFKVFWDAAEALEAAGLSE